MKLHQPMRADRTPTHTGLEQRVLARLKRLQPSDGGSIVVGFSGGADSLALAAVLARIGPLVGTVVTLVYVDHQIRSESGSDALRAQHLASSLGLPSLVWTTPGHPSNIFPGLGIEEAARRLRHVALSSAARDLGADAVAVAHHREDQAETVLLHLFRGAGLAGAAGMSEDSQLSVPWWDTDDLPIATRLWRPFLTEPRSIVREYALKTGLPPIEDPSNSDHRFVRNRVRHEVLPLLQSINPDVSAMLARYARIAGEEDLLLDRIATTALQPLLSGDGGLLVEPLIQEASPIQRRIVRSWLRRSGCSGELPFERVEAVVDMARRRRGSAIVELGAGWSVTYQHGMLTVRYDHGAPQRTDGDLEPAREDE
jgi:tRNA(Ile)-lysidine synthase